jgi:hypothetical protein
VTAPPQPPSGGEQTAGLPRKLTGGEQDAAVIGVVLAGLCPRSSFPVRSIAAAA